MRPLAVATSLREKLAQRQHLSSPVESRLFHAAMRQTQGAASQSRWTLDARSRLKIRQRLAVLKTGRADCVTLSEILPKLGLLECICPARTCSFRPATHGTGHFEATLRYPLGHEPGNPSWRCWTDHCW